MEKRDFNKNWICRCLTREEPEKKVTLPHDAMRSELRSEESRGEGNIGWYIGGDYEYTKKFPVPKEYEEASLALGATKIETIFRVSLPAARSGVATAIVLGVGRAIGEAMAIIMVSGNVPNMPGSLFTSVRFLTTAIASEMSYAAVGSLWQHALYSVGLVLFLFIMLINVFLNVFIKNKKEG